MIKDQNNISTDEMLKTFNCGIGMCVISSASRANEVIKIFNQMGEKASIIGELTTRSNNKRINFTNKNKIWNS